MEVNRDGVSAEVSHGELLDDGDTGGVVYLEDDVEVTSLPFV